MNKQDISGAMDILFLLLFVVSIGFLTKSIWASIATLSGLVTLIHFVLAKR